MALEQEEFVGDPNKENVVLDLDGVVTEFDRPFRRRAHKEKDLKVLDEHRTNREFYYHRAFPNEITSDAVAVELLDWFTVEHSVSDCVPFPESNEALERLAVLFNVHINTARPHNHREQTLELIEKHFSGLITEVHLNTRKEYICRNLGAVAIADDADHNVVSVHLATDGVTQGILVKRAHHIHNGHDLPPGVIVVPDLLTVAKVSEFRNEEGSWPEQSQIERL